MLLSGTIHQMWIDYTAMFDSDILLVHPQPASSPQDLKVVFVVHFIDHTLNLPASWRPVLVDQIMSLPTGAGAMTNRAAAFLDHPCSVTDVFPGCSCRQLMPSKWYPTLFRQMEPSQLALQ